MLGLVVHLVRVPHLSTDRVVVSLRADSGAEDVVRVAVPGRVRVTEAEVAARLARLVDSAVTHARATGRLLDIDLDAFLRRATADVAGSRRRAPAGE